MTRMAVLILAFVVAGPALAGSKSKSEVKKASKYDSSVATQWFDLSYTVAKNEPLNPVIASRMWGFLGVAAYESVVPGMPKSASLAGQMVGLDSVPAVQAGKKYDWPLVMNAALARVLKNVLVNPKAQTVIDIDTLEASILASRQGKIAQSTQDRSVLQGQAVGDAILAFAATDGFATFNNCAYTAPTGSNNLWVPTPPGFLAPLQPCWGNIRTMAILSPTAQCQPVAPPSYSEAPGSLFYNYMKEVYDTKQNLTQEQNDIALFWADGGGTGTPPGHWMLILGQILRDNNNTLDVAAEAYARVGIAVHDAFIVCWYSKFSYNLLRPVTYINRLIDPTWLSLITTPNFPTYVSGHSTQSGAAQRVLTNMFGIVAFTDHTKDSAGMQPRSFNSFFDAALEAAQSRLYGGIHFAPDNYAGLEAGECVGNAVNELVWTK
jgi:hypothetical protein